MPHSAHFARYAAAFEKAFESDDWSILAPFFTAEASYDAGGPPFGERAEGREAILERFKDVLDRFDRRFESRELTLLEGPREDGDSVWVRGDATYRSPGLPDLTFELEETAWFDGERIRRLEDRYEPAVRDTVLGWIEAHGDAIGISLPIV